MNIPCKHMNVARTVFATYKNGNYSHRASFKFCFEYAEKLLEPKRENVSNV